MRIMGVDYGDARTGIAMSDLLCSIVGSTTVIHSRRDDKTIAEIQKLIAQNACICSAKMTSTEPPGPIVVWEAFS